jgi:DNA replication protein DnaC
MSNQPEMHTPDTPHVLLEHHLKALRLPIILREYDKVAHQCAEEKTDFPRYLLRLTELELLDRDRRSTERHIRQARFPVLKSLDSFDFLAIPAANKTLVLEMARCEFLSRKENLLLFGNSGTGKFHIALALGLAACQRGHRVRFTTAAALVSELIETRDEKHMLRFQKQLTAFELLIVDELGSVTLSKTGAELLLETFSQLTNTGRFWSPATCPSTNGPRSFFGSASALSPAFCNTSFSSPSCHSNNQRRWGPVREGLGTGIPTAIHVYWTTCVTVVEVLAAKFVVAA